MMEIIRYAGGKITKPGIYQMPLEVHHSDCCEGPSVTSTTLRTLDLKSPLHAHDRWSGNPDHEVDDPNEIEGEHFRIGRAAHTLLLEPDLFAKNFATRPEEYDSWRTKASKEWLGEQQKAGRTVLTPSDMERVHGVANALRSHRWHTDGILGGVVEASLVVRDRKTGLWLKSRPDSIPLSTAFSDLKVMNDSSPDSVRRAIKSLGYDIQLALAGICMEVLTGERIEQFWIVAVESKRPHAIHVESLSLDAIYWARMRIRRALDTMAKCLSENYWPSYGLDGLEYTNSKYDTEQYVIDQGAGLLPREAEF